jgi:hypothetical protein
MIHYHAGPITPLAVANAAWSGRHALVSFARPEQVAFAAEICQSFVIDNGAFSVWQQGGTLDVSAYARFVDEWRRHPGFDWALIPDVIDGSEAENDRLFGTYRNAGGDLLRDVPVWHMHESLERLRRLCAHWPRVALGSSGEWSEVGTESWWQRMGEAMDFVCDEQGRPPCNARWSYGVERFGNDSVSETEPKRTRRHEGRRWGVLSVNSRPYQRASGRD